MNGPIAMYKLPQIIQHDFPVQLPTCMYTMKNIHGPRDQAHGSLDHVPSSDNKVDIFEQKIQEGPEMAELETKQNVILGQLAQLRKEIESLRCDLKNQRNLSNNDSVSEPRRGQITTNNYVPESIVINANPASPPFSLPIIQRLLQDSFTLAVTLYLHSSVESLPDAAKSVADSLNSFKPKPNVPVINVRVIWKQINSNASTVLTHTPVLGEANILRFLSRTLNTNLNYDDDPNSLEIDSLLDQSYLLTRVKTKAEKTSILQSFSKSLGKSQWLAGRSHPSVADIAAFSAIRQCNVSTDLGANLRKWYDRCQLL